LNINYVRGVEGNSLYINDIRVSGPKPWGGGKTIKYWKITNPGDLKRIKEEIEEELDKWVEAEVEKIIDMPDEEILKRVEDEFGNPDYEANRVKAIIDKARKQIEEEEK
jgi:hypothetical protein